MCVCDLLGDGSLGVEWERDGGREEEEGDASSFFSGESLLLLPLLLRRSSSTHLCFREGHSRERTRQIISLFELLLPPRFSNTTLALPSSNSPLTPSPLFFLPITTFQILPPPYSKTPSRAEGVVEDGRSLEYSSPEGTVRDSETCRRLGVLLWTTFLFGLFDLCSISFVLSQPDLKPPSTPQPTHNPKAKNRYESH